MDIPVLKNRRLELIERVDFTKSEALLRIVKKTLDTYGLRLQDITSITTDVESR